MYMPGSPNTSFIPKRNPAHSDKRSSKKTLYLGSFFVKVIFVAALLATVAVFLYERNIKSALDAEIIALNDSIATFNEADMQRVLEMDLRLSQMNYRLEHTASIASLLTAIGEATIESAQIEAFELERVTDATFEVDVAIKTGSFDSVIFQRKLFTNNDKLSISELKDVQLQNVPPNNSLFAGEVNSGEEEVRVSFRAMLSVEADKIPHSTSPVLLPSPAIIPAVIINPEPIILDLATSTDPSLVPEENISQTDI